MQQGALLWVYEGMTQYLGNVLAARSGLMSQAEYRDLLALSAANLDYRVGREWRANGRYSHRGKHSSRRRSDMG